MSAIPTCAVTGAIPGDGGACGDCDPCIDGEALVPEAVKRLIAEKNSLLNQIGELEGNLEPLVAAMDQLLDDMGLDGTCVCLAAKAQARIAFEPFIASDAADIYMPLEIANRIAAEADQ